MPLSSDAHELLGLLAYIYLDHSRPEKAAVLLQAMHRLGLATPREQITLALALLRSDKPQLALEALDRVALTARQDATYFLIQSQALHALHRGVQAQAAMQTYLQLRANAAPDLREPGTAAFVRSGATVVAPT